MPMITKDAMNSWGTLPKCYHKLCIQLPGYKDYFAQLFIYTVAAHFSLFIAHFCLLHDKQVTTGINKYQVKYNIK